MVSPKFDTSQERLVAEALSSLGLRYKEQQEFGQYTVDFWIPEINVVVEADGPHGHYNKRDLKRDADLYSEHNVNLIMHVVSDDINHHKTHTTNIGRLRCRVNLHHTK